MIIEKLRAVSNQLFNKRALLVSFTADKEGYDVLEKAMDTLIKQMPDEPFVKAEWNMPLEKMRAYAVHHRFNLWEELAIIRMPGCHLEDHFLCCKTS